MQKRILFILRRFSKYKSLEKTNAPELSEANLEEYMVADKENDFSKPNMHTAPEAPCRTWKAG